mmetsp:Transcript_11438/g.17387  ORF Transcript_11438/g.17387 Transcript_11438/m.17387 type:complete len:143 (-) Transcript_11438:160-588(-)|eukprot:CAMPEP_0194296808 /NCGR_PEP_ID=MMETSP0169-20130528/57242_1 /TAXON_ID=218684 /ORGANISM="Corethron pennatum, Strain L29A3" /LENGTH=142 /DNA_ID=CAMNT_0039046405 /DNA_START=159 /DNA_END=590 /DNA_ORIENTATION=-
MFQQTADGTSNTCEYASSYAYTFRSLLRSRTALFSPPRRHFSTLNADAKRAHVTRPCDRKINALSEDVVTGGFSGAELVAICREAALSAIEGAGDGPPDPAEGPLRVRMAHLRAAAAGMKRQITPEMLRFYESFRGKGRPSP